MKTIETSSKWIGTYTILHWWVITYELWIPWYFYKLNLFKQYTSRSSVIPNMSSNLHDLHNCCNREMIVLV